MALPWLESLRVFGAPSPFPKRFGVMFMGCGINEDYWSATGDGAEMTLSKTLSPLEPLKHKINVVDGLFNKAATGQGIHPAQTGSLLSGAQISKGAVLHSGMSVDQMIAKYDWPGYGAVEDRAGVGSAHDGISRDQFLDGLQLARLVAEPVLPGAGGALPLAGLRQPVRESRQPA